jgi:hypothetical protein
VTAPLTPEQERALRERIAALRAVDRPDVLAEAEWLLAALDAERERSVVIQTGWANATLACAKAEVERDAAQAMLEHEREMRRIDLRQLDKRDAEVVAARTELAEARAEIERLKRADSRKRLALDEYARSDPKWNAMRAELAAIIALRDLPPGAPAPEHEGDAYAVAVRFRNQRDTSDQLASDWGVDCTLKDRVINATRARVAELEAENARLRRAIDLCSGSCGRAALEGK